MQTTQCHAYPKPELNRRLKLDKIWQSSGKQFILLSIPYSLATPCFQNGGLNEDELEREDENENENENENKNENENENTNEMRR